MRAWTVSTDDDELRNKILNTLGASFESRVVQDRLTDTQRAPKGTGARAAQLHTGLTSGMAYTKLPIGLNEPEDSPGVDVARCTIVQVLINVKCTWPVVWRALGSGKDSSLGFIVGSCSSI